MEADEEYYIIKYKLAQRTQRHNTREQDAWYATKRNENSMLFLFVVVIACVSTASVHIQTTIHIQMKDIL